MFDNEKKTLFHHEKMGRIYAREIIHLKTNTLKNEHPV